MRKYLFLTLCVLQFLITNAQNNVKEVVYKTVDTTQLIMKLYYPDDFKPEQKRSAIIFFFGGGWVGGTIDQFKHQALYLASRGMIAITADYRVRSRHHTTPFECVKDGRSAIRYLRKHAAELGIDPDRIVAAGGSAGGQVAAATDLIEIDEATDDISISARPNALVLFNPVFNNGPDNYGYKIFGDDYVRISPYHNIKKGAAPTIVFLGTKDKHIPVKTAEDYQKKMRAIGNRCDLFLYADQPHGFFNYREKGNKYYEETLMVTTRFLIELGFLPANK